MALSLPIIILLSGSLYLFIHKDGMKFWHAFVAMVLGFELSTTIFAGEIASAVHAADHLIASVFSI